MLKNIVFIILRQFLYNHCFIAPSYSLLFPRCYVLGKDPDAGRDWGQEEKGTTEDEMAGWYHRLDGFEFE